MIKYNPGGGLHFFMRLLQMSGSVLPKSIYVAAPCGMVAVFLKILINREILTIWGTVDSILTQSQAWSGFSGLVGFLVVFRTSQSYVRFWGGCTATHQMRAEWFDACSAVFAFCKISKRSIEEVETFQAKLIRLFSMLHAAALAELEEMNHDVDSLDDVQAFGYRLIDPEGLDPTTLSYLKQSASKVELLFSWIQMLLVEGIETGVLGIPPPILSRSFQELASGMVAFHDAVKITYIPFPFPYAQICDLLLVIHFVFAPVVITQWVTEPVWAFVFVFIQVFILWSLNFIACEIENPFGTDANDLDGWGMQEEMNRHLMLLLHPQTKNMPKLAEGAMRLQDMEDMDRACNMSFNDVWSGLPEEELVPTPARKGKTFLRCSQVQLKVTPVTDSAGSSTGRKTLRASLASQGTFAAEPSAAAHIRTMSLTSATAMTQEASRQELAKDPMQAAGYVEASTPPPSGSKDGPLRAVQRPCRRVEEGQEKESKPADAGEATKPDRAPDQASGWRQRTEEKSLDGACSPSKESGSRCGNSPREPSTPAGGKSQDSDGKPSPGRRSGGEGKRTSKR